MKEKRNYKENYTNEFDYCNDIDDINDNVVSSLKFHIKYDENGNFDDVTVEEYDKYDDLYEYSKFKKEFEDFKNKLNSLPVEFNKYFADAVAFVINNEISLIIEYLKSVNLDNETIQSIIDDLKKYNLISYDGKRLVKSFKEAYINIYDYQFKHTSILTSKPYEENEDTIILSTYELKEENKEEIQS